jgi:hypothetical protein
MDRKSPFLIPYFDFHHLVSERTATPLVIRREFASLFSLAKGHPASKVRDSLRARR